MRTILVGLALSLSACVAPPKAVPPQTPAGDERPLAQVTSVRLAPAGRDLLITVRAMAPTPGYSGLRLRMVNYVQAPPDGIYDFTAVGVAPDGTVAQVLAPVEFSYAWRGLGADVKGVRVHAAAGSITEVLRP